METHSAIELNTWFDWLRVERYLAACSREQAAFCIKNDDLTQRRPSFFLIAGGVVGFAQEVVDAGVVDAGELDEDGGGDVVFTCFIFAVAGLGHIEHFGDRDLFPVMILAKVADALIFHFITPVYSMLNLKWNIDTQPETGYDGVGKR